MYKPRLELPLQKGGDLFPGLPGAPTVVRTTINTPPDFAEMSTEDLQRLAAAIISDNYGAITRHVQAHRQSADLSNTQYAGEARTFPGGSSRMVTSMGRSTLLLNLHPQVEPITPTPYQFEPETPEPPQVDVEPPPEPWLPEFPVEIPDAKPIRHSTMNSRLVRGKPPGFVINIECSWTGSSWDRGNGGGVGMGGQDAYQPLSYRAFNAGDTLNWIGPILVDPEYANGGNNTDRARFVGYSGFLTNSRFEPAPTSTTLSLFPTAMAGRDPWWLEDPYTVNGSPISFGGYYLTQEALFREVEITITVTVGIPVYYTVVEQNETVVTDYVWDDEMQMRVPKLEQITYEQTVVVLSDDSNGFVDWGKMSRVLGSSSITKRFIMPTNPSDTAKWEGIYPGIAIPIGAVQATVDFDLQSGGVRLG